MADVSIANVHSLSNTQPLLYDLAEILMEVDPFIYPALFADEANREDVLSELASMDESPLACEHWRVATVDGKVTGICVRQVRRIGSMGGEWRDLGLDPSSSDACERYLSGICDDTADGSVYVMALATQPDFRRRGIGRAMLDDAIMSPGAITGAYLDVLASNAPAIRLYEGFGFRVYDEVDGYAYGRPAPHVLRMARVPSDLAHRIA